MGFKGRSLVAQAAFSGDKATFEAVTTALVTRLPPEEVRYRLFSLPISLVKIYEPFSYAGTWTRLLSRGHYADWKSNLDLNCHEEIVNKNLGFLFPMLERFVTGPNGLRSYGYCLWLIWGKGRLPCTTNIYLIVQLNVRSISSTNDKSIRCNTI